MTIPSVHVEQIPAIGAPAPEFAALSTSGEQVALAGFRGERPVLLAFFPLAFTSTCTSEVCSFSEDYDQFAASGVAVLPMSVDAAPSLRAFREKYDLRVDLLSDFRREISARYGVLDPEKLYARRSYFLIDRDGILRWSHVESVGGQRRSNDELLAQIRTLA